MERRRVRALSAHTVFVPGYGQVHFDPDNPKEDIHHPLMPVDSIPRLVRDGWIADDLEGRGAGNDLSQLDHDGDGEPGGSLPHNPPVLAGKNKASLIQIAADEGVILTDGLSNKDIVAAIEAARVAAEIGGASEGEGEAPA